MLIYSLYKSHLTASNGSYYPRVVGSQTFNLNDIINKMISRGSTVTKAEAMSVLEEFSLAIVDIVANGGSITTALFTIKPSASGKFADLFDGWDSSRHSVSIKLKAGPRIQAVINQIEMKKQKANLPRPELIELLDAATGAQTQDIVPLKLNVLRGSGLSMDLDDVEQGVFLTPDGGESIRVEEFGKMKPSELLFTIPDNLAIGEYTMELRKRRTPNSEMRIGVLPYALNVA